MQYVQSILASGMVPPDLNYTYLALIPKGDVQKEFSAFRPISLCNNIYKVVTKVSVNRLKPGCICLFLRLRVPLSWSVC